MGLRALAQGLSALQAKPCPDRAVHHHKSGKFQINNVQAGLGTLKAVTGNAKNLNAEIEILI